MGQELLVAFDGSDPSERAIETAATAFVDPELTAIYVLDPSELVGYAGMEGSVMTDIEQLRKDRETEAEDILDRARALAETHGVETETAIEHGDIANRIVAYAREHDVDHLVVGSHGRRGVRRLLLGSVAERIVRRSPISVTVVR